MAKNKFEVGDIVTPIDNTNTLHGGKSIFKVLNPDYYNGTTFFSKNDTVIRIEPLVIDVRCDNLQFERHFKLVGPGAKVLYAKKN